MGGGAGQEVVAPPLEPDAADDPAHQQADDDDRDHPPPHRHPWEPHGWAPVRPGLLTNMALLARQVILEFIEQERKEGGK
jgi:hypothetical protein